MSSSFSHLAHFLAPAARLETGSDARRAPSPQALLQLLARGGVAQIKSFKGGSKTWFALSCLSIVFKYHEDPPLSLWISDEGWLNPELLPATGILLSHVLMVKSATPEESWRLTLESVQTGLFSWILVRTSQPCHPSQLRKLQLSTERNHTRVLILSQMKLPHWTLRAHLNVDESYENYLFADPKSKASRRLRGSVPLANSQGLSTVASSLPT